MPLDVAVYLLRGNVRSQKIGAEVAKGIAAAGDRPVVRPDNEYRGVREPVAVFYGFEKNHPQIMADYRAAGQTVVFIDLGYWGRREGGRWGGYHKVAINDRHPTQQFQARRHDDSRLRRFGLRPRPWRKAGTHILLAGMSGKSAESYGLQPGEWERRTIAELRRHTRREIVYRPKPSWIEAQPLPDSRFSPAKEPLVDVLRDCHAVVTHHSNVGVDGLVAGIPAFCWDGVARPLALQDLSRIEKPWLPDGREQWACDVSWWQWSVAEMRSGEMWRFLKGEGRVG